MHGRQNIAYQIMEHLHKQTAEATETRDTYGGADGAQRFALSVLTPDAPTGHYQPAQSACC